MNGHRSWMHKGKEKDKEEETDKDKDHGKDKEKESTISEDRFVHLDEGTLADHAISKHDAKTSQDFNALYKVSILQINPHDMDAAEQIWIHKLCTMTPFGLNIDKPRGVADTLMSMSQRSSLSPPQRRC